MDVNDPPPQELPADPDAANVFLDTVNAVILRRWCKVLGLRLKRNVKRAGLLKVLFLIIIRAIYFQSKRACSILIQCKSTC